MTDIRIKSSRAIAWLFFRESIMICAMSELYRWKIRHIFNFIFFWTPNHCRKCLDWELRQREKEKDFVDYLREKGL